MSHPLWRSSQLSWPRFHCEKQFSSPFGAKSTYSSGNRSWESLSRHHSSPMDFNLPYIASWIVLRIDNVYWWILSPYNEYYSSSSPDLQWLLFTDALRLNPMKMHQSLTTLRLGWPESGRFTSRGEKIVVWQLLHLFASAMQPVYHRFSKNEIPSKECHQDAPITSPILLQHQRQRQSRILIQMFPPNFPTNPN